MEAPVCVQEIDTHRVSLSFPFEKASPRFVLYSNIKSIGFAITMIINIFLSTPNQKAH